MLDSDVVEILKLVEGWAGSQQAALVWFRSSPLPSFGGQTAEGLIREGRAEDVRCYIHRIGVGGFA